MVEAVWDIIPCPENLINRIAINSKDIELTLEKMKVDIANKKITKNENFITSKSSIFFPTQISTTLLNKVAAA